MIVLSVGTASMNNIFLICDIQYWQAPLLCIMCNEKWNFMTRFPCKATIQAATSTAMDFIDKRVVSPHDGEDLLLMIARTCQDEQP